MILVQEQRDEKKHTEVIIKISPENDKELQLALSAIGFLSAIKNFVSDDVQSH